MSRPTARSGALATILAVLMGAALGAPLGPTARDAAAQADWAPPRTVFVAATGHTVDGVFLDVWRAWGAASAWGDPVTEEVTEAGHVVQYYEYARLEYWPEDPNGEVVHLGRIGAELHPVAIPRRPTPDGLKDTIRLMLAWVPLGDTASSQPTTESWRLVPETGHSVQKGFKAFWEATGEAAYLGNPLTEEYQLAGVTYQVFERGQLAWAPDVVPYMVPVGTLLAERYGLDTSPVGQGDLPTYSEDLFVPPPPAPILPQPEPNAERWIEVNLSWQYLTAWQGDVAILETYVSTGRPGFETPTGTFYINSKLEAQTMEGVVGGEYYNVPDVPWVMYFTDGGHALHGTYWHSNFGVQMSHGCVNLPMWAAEVLYGWAPIGTRVEIHY